MLNKKLYAILIVLSLFIHMGSNAESRAISNSDCIKILVIDFEKTENDSDIGKKIQFLFDRWMADIKKQIEALEKIAESLEKSSDEKKSFDIKSKVNIPDFDVKKFEGETQKNRRIMLYSLAQKKSLKMHSLMKDVSGKFNKFIREKVRKIAERCNSDIVFDSSVLIYGKCTKDITDEVIREINADKRSFEIPEVLKNYDK